MLGNLMSCGNAQRALIRFLKINMHQVGFHGNIIESIVFFFFSFLKVALMVNQMHRAKGKGYLKWTPHVPNLTTAALTSPQKV